MIKYLLSVWTKSNLQRTAIDEMTMAIETIVVIVAVVMIALYIAWLRDYRRIQRRTKQKIPTFWGQGVENEKEISTKVRDIPRQNP